MAVPMSDQSRSDNLAAEGEASFDDVVEEFETMTVQKSPNSSLIARLDELRDSEYSSDESPEVNYEICDLADEVRDLADKVFELAEELREFRSSVIKEFAFLRDQARAITAALDRPENQKLNI
jgi:uncharacterized coiled-coil DUF342 family protein